MTEQSLPLLPTPIAKLHDLCCGCGSPELFWQPVLEVLRHCAVELGQRPAGSSEWFYASPERYFVANVLDAHELTEHGTSIGCAWLTDAGREALAFLETHGVAWADGQWIDAEGVSRGTF